MGCYRKSSERKTAYDIFRSQYDNLPINFEEVVTSTRSKLSFIPANMLLSAAEINLGGVNGAAAILAKTLENEFFQKYDYVIIDSPPSFGFLTLNSMYAADIILVPMDLSYFSLNSVDSVYRVTGLLNSETGKEPLVAFVLNMFDRRSNFAKRFEDDAKKRLGSYLLPTKIRSSVRLRESSEVGKTVFEHSPKSNAALDFYNLTSEILTIDSKDFNTTMKEFAISAPQAASVHILGDFNDWKKTENSRLDKIENGSWSTHLMLKKGKYHYKFLVDDQWIHDPSNLQREANAFGSINSIMMI
jgi:chromosome partitioning protein